MNSPAQLAKHVKEVYFGGNWTWVNLKDTLADVTWQQATTKMHSFNTIGVLVYHINYYVGAITDVLQEKPLTAHDRYAFDMPPVQSKEDWDNMLAKIWIDAENLVGLIEQLPEHKLWENFSEEKYGLYYRNLLGFIEHTHYHMGQIVILKKLLQLGDA